MTEAKFQADVIKFLKSQGIQVFKYPGLITAGVPDLLCNFFGKFVAIELKVGKYQPTALQIKTLQSIRNTGGYSFVFRHTLEWEDRLYELMQDCLHKPSALLTDNYPLPEMPKDVII